MENNENSGLYIIETHLSENVDIIVGKRGLISFEKGYYYYIGSAKKNLSQRVARHLRMRKKSKWHIDYLTKKSKEKKAFFFHNQLDECGLMEQVLRKHKPDGIIKEFGCSDCKCPSHLIFSQLPLSLLKDYQLKM